MIRVGPPTGPVGVDLSPWCSVVAGAAVCAIAIPHVPRDVEHNVRAAHDGDAGGEFGNQC